MPVLKDFLCRKCGAFEKIVDRDDTVTECPSCDYVSERVFIQAPALTGEIRHEFKPHYDHQFGQHFQTREEKKAYLEKTGRVQYSGPLSPPKSTQMTPYCTKQQAAREFGLVEPKRTSSLARNETI